MTEKTPVAAHTGGVAHQFVALAAGLLGLATAWTDGVALHTFAALASAVFAISAYAGFVRLSQRLGGKQPLPPAAHAGLTLLLPGAFVLLIVVGTDAMQRDALGWNAFATGLPLGLLAVCLLFTQQIARRERDLECGHQTLATRLEPGQLKLAYMLITLLAYTWLVAQVAAEHLPQYTGVAAITLVLSFRAARALNDHARGETDALPTALRLSTIAAPLFGLLMAGGLLLHAL